MQCSSRDFLRAPPSQIYLRSPGGGLTAFPWTRMHRETQQVLLNMSDRIGDLESVPTPILQRADLDESIKSLNALALSLGAQSDAMQEQLAELVQSHKQTMIAVAEGIERVERYERRIKNTVRRAQKELAEQGFTHDGLEAEGEELHLVDGEGGNGERLPPVPGSVDEAESAPSSIPGVSQAILFRARGR